VRKCAWPDSRIWTKTTKAEDNIRLFLFASRLQRYPARALATVIDMSLPSLTFISHVKRHIIS